MKDREVKMIQRSKQRWDIVAPKGHILLEGIVVGTRHEAEEFVKKYVSSFLCWSYVIIPKEKK